MFSPEKHYKKPEPYIRVIELLAKKKMGMTRLDLLAVEDFSDNQNRTKIYLVTNLLLEDLKTMDRSLKY